MFVSHLLGVLLLFTSCRCLLCPLVEAGEENFARLILLLTIDVEAGGGVSEVLDLVLFEVGAPIKFPTLSLLDELELI